MSATKEHYHNQIEDGMRPAEHPILYNTEMVQAIIELRKKQTRRTNGLKTVNENPEQWEFMGLEIDATIKVFKNFVLFKEKLLPGLYAQFRKLKKEEFCYCQCPYGQPGDLLWVRETFIEFPVGDYNYKTDSDPVFIKAKTKWSPSIHMPKVAARIWLQVEEVTVQRLQDIPTEDIAAEGLLIPVSENNKPLFMLGVKNSALDFMPDGCFADGMPAPTERQVRLAFFAELWSKTYGIESWHSNPWVWAVKFKVLSTTGKPYIHAFTH